MLSFSKLFKKSLPCNFSCLLFCKSLDISYFGNYTFIFLIFSDFYLQTPSGLFLLLQGKTENYSSKGQISYVETKCYFEAPVLNGT